MNQLITEVMPLAGLQKGAKYSELGLTWFFLTVLNICVIKVKGPKHKGNCFNNYTDPSYEETHITKAGAFPSRLENSFWQTPLQWKYFPSERRCVVSRVESAVLTILFFVHITLYRD